MPISEFCISSPPLALHGRCYRPAAEGQFPVIILGHEFGLTMRSPARFAKRLCPAGFVVLVFDFCGSGKSRGRKAAETSVLTQKEDLALVLDYAKTLPFADFDHVILGGCSQGGLAAALLAAEREAEIEKLVLLYPGFSIPDNTRKSKSAAPFLKRWQKYIADACTLEPWREICGFSKPVLICHGTADTIVSIRYARDAANRYANCQLVEFRGGHHMLFASVNRAVNEILTFLQH